MKLYKAETRGNQTYVFLQDKNGIYKGKSRIHPDDMEHKSSYRGYCIAEYRAWIDYYKKKIKEEKIKLKTVQNLKKDFLKNDPTLIKKYLKRFNIQIRNCENNIKNFQEEIKEINESIETSKKFWDYIKKRTKAKKDSN